MQGLGFRVQRSSGRRASMTACMGDSSFGLCDLFQFRKPETLNPSVSPKLLWPDLGLRLETGDLERRPHDLGVSAR